MKTYSILTVLLLLSVCSFAQTITQKIDKAVRQLQADAQMKHATMSLYVVETQTGKPVYALNEQVGLAPASTQKIFTSVAAFELLGKDYRYKTEVGYDGEIKDSVLNGNIYITGYGDPTFGSLRFANTRPEIIKQKVGRSISELGIKDIAGYINFDNSRFSYQPIPDGWIWEDIGNYYGAGSWALNWNENQYDLKLIPGKNEGDAVQLSEVDPKPDIENFNNLLRTGKPGSGDNAYIYLPPYSKNAFATGTIPPGKNSFTISGAQPNPSNTIRFLIEDILEETNITYSGRMMNIFKEFKHPESENDFSYNNKVITTFYSPTLDSINYWFLQKSINLYGEALIKTIAYEKTGFGATEKGIELLKDFWSKNGIEKSANNIVDGSGLSPQNRVTTDAMVKALQYAKDKNWYNSFYTALPTYNGMHMKSGTIGGAKAYTGYHTSKSGTAYTFAIIINNYDSEGGSIVSKMYKLLDELK
ncbi:D-alanyl-D-alanine carboxypeptidase/D-alanyl-D-alanine-endopeptidase [soil metagenome]